MKRAILFLLLAALPTAAQGDGMTPQEILARVAKSKSDPAVAAQALTELDALIAANQKNAPAQYARAQILSALGRKAEAVTAYDAALQIDPKFPDASYNAGVILLGLGKMAQGIAHLEAATATNPKDADAFYDLGQARYNTKDFE